MIDVIDDDDQDDMDWSGDWTYLKGPSSPHNAHDDDDDTAGDDDIILYIGVGPIQSPQGYSFFLAFLRRCFLGFSTSQLGKRQR